MAENEWLIVENEWLIIELEWMTIEYEKMWAKRDATLYRAHREAQ